MSESLKPLTLESIPACSWDLINRLTYNFNAKLHEMFDDWHLTPKIPLSVPYQKFDNFALSFHRTCAELLDTLVLHEDYKEDTGSYTALERRLINQVCLVTLMASTIALGEAALRLPENILRKSWFLDVALASLYGYDSVEDPNLPTELSSSVMLFTSNQNLYLPHQILIIQGLFDVLCSEFKLKYYDLHVTHSKTDQTSGNEAEPTLIPTKYRIAYVRCRDAAATADDIVLVAPEFIEHVQELGYATHKI